MEYSTINSKLYKLLLDEGGDKLIAIYLILKSAKNSKSRILAEKTSQGKSIKFYRLLHKKTKLSEATLKKYVPKLINLGICNFSANGSFYILGNNKTNKRFDKKNCLKIEVSNLIKTALNSYLVRVKALEKTQIKNIEKHQRQINIISRAERGFFLKKSEKNTLKRLIKKEITISKLNTHCDKVVLSNKGFAFLKDLDKDKKSKGYYHKQKLIKANLIKTKREFKFLIDCSYLDFLIIKRETNNRKLVFRNNKLYIELVSSFKVLV